MNIFALDQIPEKAAQYHVDKHVVKMPLEYAQLLSTAHVIIDNKRRGYAATHIHHPSAKWARLNRNTYLWLYELFRHTSREYHHRYGRHHKSWLELETELEEPPAGLLDEPFRPPYLAMPAIYMKPGDCVGSYRLYYNEDKRELHSWTNRPKPEWIT